MAIDRAKMAEFHEQFLAKLNGGVKSKASGSQWTDQADGRNCRITTDFAFAWDGKSTCGQGISVTRDMLRKIREQAGGERPQIGLRFYETERLDAVAEEWIAVTAADFGELLEAARGPAVVPAPEIALSDAELDAFRAALEKVLEGKHAEIAGPGTARVLLVPPDWYQQAEAAIAGQSRPPAPQLPPEAMSLPLDMPDGFPGRSLWPCTLVEVWHDSGGQLHKRGYHIGLDGRTQSFAVGDVRVEPVSAAESRLIVNDQVVRRGELHTDGKLTVRVRATGA